MIIQRVPEYRRPTAVDLFCGAGGLSLGFEQAGFDVLASVDYDPVHAATHEFNFPLASTLCGDLGNLTAETLHDAAAQGWQRHRPGVTWSGEIDVVFGGPPCQGFSTIGKRLVDDPRNTLVFHFFRIVCELSPRYFVMENVPGMAAGGHSGILQQLVEEFRAVGYETAPVRTLNAKHFGVPQDRTRLFLLGWRTGEAPLSYPDAAVRPVAKRASNQTVLGAADLPDGPNVWDALGDLPDLDQFDELVDCDAVMLDAAAVDHIERTASDYARRLRQLNRDPRDLSIPRHWDPRILSSSTRTKHTELSTTRFAETDPGDTEPVSRFYRLDPHGLCNTLRAGTSSERGAYTSPRPIHPTLPRVISVREAARLHSFPDWFRLHVTKWHGFRQIGNAVPPLLGRAVAHQIVTALDAEPLGTMKAVPLGDPALLTVTMSQAAAHFDADMESIPKARQRAAVV